jgi:hypothetical protein
VKTNYEFPQCNFHHLPVGPSFLQGNGPVGQVEISPEILFVYRAHLVMIVHKISAADTLCKAIKNIVQSWNVQFLNPLLALML